MDLIVLARPAPDLRRRLERELPRHFPIRAREVRHTAGVYVLRQERRGALPESRQAEAVSYSGAGLQARGSRLAPLIDFLQNSLNTPVLDETGLTGRYDLVFTVEQENLRPSLEKALRKMGLKLDKEQREVEMLELTAAP
ncbi:MAG: DUF3738 domain-containing protein [Hymenobacter sp.]|nr:DUF3738 domain-containing protein [Hymenobacter sp.]